MGDQPRVIYFDIRGRAEPIRLLLEEAGVEYVDEHAEADWLARKADTPFGVLPLYEHGSLHIPESQAILRHLAREHDLYGDGEEERVRCDVAAEALVDARSLLGMFPWRSDAEAQRETFVGQELPGTLGRLERFLRSNPAGPPWFAGSRMSFADLKAFSFVDDVDAQYPEALEACPGLRELWQAVAARPRIRAYLQSGRRPRAIQYIAGAQRIFDERDA